MSEFKNPRRINNPDGSYSIWTYDFNITKSGPVSVEHFYPSNYNHYPDYTKPENQDIPVKNRVYIDPKTKKEVTHSKALKLGLAI